MRIAERGGGIIGDRNILLSCINFDFVRPMLGNRSSKARVTLFL